MEYKRISILVDNDSWIIPYARKLEQLLSEAGHDVQFVRNHNELGDGWINFMLGCTRILSSEKLKKNKHNLVVHESDLPLGRGFSPMTWQILEGKNRIPICLLDVGVEPDSGVIWIKDEISLNGNELSAEWRNLQGEKTVELCCRFVNEFETLSSQSQSGEATWYVRRRPEDSRLDVKRTIEEQFNFLRTVDNEKYPAYFELNGRKFIIKITSQ